MKSKLLSLGLAMAMILTLTACGSSSNYALRILATAPVVSSDNAEDYASTITVGDDEAVSVTTEAINTTSNDSLLELTNSTTILTVSTQIASKEIDIMLTDYYNASYFANSDVFMPLDELFTEDELSAIDSSLFVYYDETDDDGNSTGETLAVYGIDVTSVSEFSEFITADQIVINVLYNAQDTDAVKEYILSILS